MNAILTSTKRIGKSLFIVAKSASGKFCQVKPATFNESEHKQAALGLSIKLGWGTTLIGGETKEGFAYIPVAQQTEKLSTQDIAEMLSSNCAKLTPSSQDPIRFASGIETLSKILNP